MIFMLIASWFQLPNATVIKCLALPIALLMIVSVWLLWVHYQKPHKNIRELVLRVKTFWLIVGLVGTSLLLKPFLAIMFWAFVSYLALKEYFTMIPTRQIDRRVLFWAYLAIPVQYYFIEIGSYALMAIFIPVYVFLFLPFRMVLLSETSGFLRSISTIHWGVMMMVYSVSCIAAFYLLDPNRNPAGSGATGLIFYLLFLNQLNDAAQFFFGKNFGKHKIIPKVSPNKTVEGFLGGVGTSIVVAVLLAPYLTPLSFWHACIVGGIVSSAGFVGDITMSALKRDLQIKDTGNLLPGHGGLLDRIDSLVFAAPLLFHYVRYFYY